MFLSHRIILCCQPPRHRVSRLRDDLLTLRAECSSVYSKGRTLTTEQTKMMISGITQSLNSGFPQSINASLTPAINPALTSGDLGTPGSTFTSGLTPCLTPALTPMQPALVQSYMGNSGGMEPGNLMHLKHMQIRKPLLKSSLADPSMTEEEVNMKYVQDLLNWVEEMQVSCFHPFLFLSCRCYFKSQEPKIMFFLFFFIHV